MFRVALNVGFVLASLYGAIHFSSTVAKTTVALNSTMGFVVVGAVVLVSHMISSGLRLAAGK